MIEIRYYECEHCGKRFEDEGECHAHELQEKMGNLIDGFTLYNSTYNIINPTDLVANQRAFDEVFFAVIHNKEAGNALNDFIENELGYSFYSEAGEPHSFPCVLGFWQDECWQNLSEMRKDIDEVFNHIS